MNLFFWEPNISPHKIPLAASLINQPGISKLTYCAQEELSETRASQGLTVSMLPGIDYVLGRSNIEIDALIESSPLDTIHLFSGLRRVPCIVAGLQAAIRHRRRFAIMSEPRSAIGLAGAARRLQSRITEKEIRRNVGFVLAIGRHGPAWFRTTGYRPNLIFPFAYYPLERSPYREKSQETADPVICFVGRLEPSKGFDLFLEAAPALSKVARIEIAGTGSLAERARATAEASFGRITYRGVVPMPQIPDFLAGCDVLVLPSTTDDDGWGVVVSEALDAGCLALASSYVGSSICLDDGRLGAVIECPSPSNIQSVVLECLKSADLSARGRRARHDWAQTHLTAQAGAEYLLKIVAHVYDGAPRPRPFYD